MSSSYNIDSWSSISSVSSCPDVPSGWHVEEVPPQRLSCNTSPKHVSDHENQSLTAAKKPRRIEKHALLVESREKRENDVRNKKRSDVMEEEIRRRKEYACNSGWVAFGGQGDTYNMGLQPSTLISLTAPKPCARFFKGRHFLCNQLVHSFLPVSPCHLSLTTRSLIPTFILSSPADHSD